jgi:glycosyltransferase involved in cell wall biosynthesis
MLFSFRRAGRPRSWAQAGAGVERVYAHARWHWITRGPRVGLGECRMAAQSYSLAPWPRVSVVIPTLNEARNLPHVFGALPSGIHEIIVVDGHSVDGTLAVVQDLRPDARIVMQTRSGKGNALACGCAEATGDIIAMIDADGSTDAGEILRFVSALLDGADFAKGTRFARGGGSEDITRLRSLGNHMLTGMVNLLYGTRYTDLCYGFNAFWRKHLPVLGFDATALSPAGKSGCPWGDGFEIETLINIRTAAAGLAITEVPSFEHSRIHGVSNLSALSDGIRVLRTILHERFTIPPQNQHVPARRHSAGMSGPPSHRQHTPPANLRRVRTPPPT